MKSLPVTSLLALLICISGLSAKEPEVTPPGRWSAEKANTWYKEQPWLVG